MFRITLVLLLMINTVSFADNFSDAIEAYDRQDYIEAYRLFTELEDLGHVDAMNNLATMYQTGMGIPRNYVKAAELYLKAAQAGHIDAAFNYSTLSRLGIGTNKNMAESYAWAVIAARHGASDLVAYRDVLATKILPKELEDGSLMAENILNDFAQYEYAIGWLLPNNVRIASRETPLPKIIEKIERISADGEVTIIKNEDLIKITEENINQVLSPSYRALMTTYPLMMNTYRSSLYRPLLNSARHSSDKVLRPRRMLGERSVPIVEALEIDQSLLPLFQSLADSYSVHINDIVRAVQTINPDAFEADLPLRLKDSDARLKIPDYLQVKHF
ncbi:tetratricopeptide repeat protein [Wohlfahrtiimonas larvae]|uniref:Sel1 repeat family protein n=1 Tax=Wohlfahrtiimonas larvae TaxID=1157986 RepID=A0ABP9MDB9_9GAMM|nr:tetratricopeptide repeat protein [Wohlfahrtiimonas larvae]